MQKTYTAEFKREAVRLAQTSRKPIAQLARELGISDPSIHRGTRNWPLMETKPFREAAIRRRRREELRPLNRELEVTQQEFDNLKNLVSNL